MKAAIDLSLYLVTDSGLSRGRSLTEVVEAALSGGVTALQYREKDKDFRHMLEEARILRQLCREAGIAFIVNDRLDLALAVDADGVHVGQSDMPAQVARKLLGPDKLLGISAGTVDLALTAQAEGADYIGAGPVFATATKPDADQPIGLEGLRSVCSVLKLPVVAIGGINADNAAGIIEAGAAGVAVVSAIVSADDIRKASASLKSVILAAKGSS